MHHPLWLLVLGVSRNTVLAALNQLAVEGYLLSRPGSGTYISRDLPDVAPRAASNLPAAAPGPSTSTAASMMLSHYGQTILTTPRMPLPSLTRQSPLANAFSDRPARPRPVPAPPMGANHHSTESRASN
ncbi:GntR family transcriptional regulator [Rhodococcoides fascians]|uniref:GntR family transcriptional regulator n=1 Tax=Rhodococcoides fascians TaxID=1828 RepID=UPI0019D35095